MKTIRIIAAAVFLVAMALSVQAQNLDSVLARLRSDTAQERVAALRQLAKMPADLRAVEPLMNTLNDTSPDVRGEALKTWGLKAKDYDEAVEKAHRGQKSLTKAQNDAEYQVWKDWQKRWLDAVEGCVNDSSETVGKEAIRALAKLGYLSLTKIGYCAGTSISMLPLEFQAHSRALGVIERQPKWLLCLEEEKDIEIAQVLVMGLNYVDYPPAYPLLKRLLRRADSAWRVIGCRGLATKKDWGKDLLPLLSDTDNQVRESAVFGVVRARLNPLARLAPSFHTSSVLLRRSIVQLIQWEDTTDYDFLLSEACRDRDGDVIADTLVVMERRRGTMPKEYKGEIADDYVRSLLRHPHPRVRVEAASLLWPLEGAKPLALFIPLLYDSSKEVQERVMLLLVREQDARLPAAYIHALRRTQTKETWLVSTILAHNWEYTEPLVRNLLQDRERLCRLAVVCALREREHPERMNWLAKAARDSDAEVRSNAAGVLGEKTDARTTQILVDLLADRDREVRRSAICGLRGTQDEKARSILLRLTRSEDKEIAEVAKWALEEKRE
jgi:HEAT repeat protein